LKKFYTSLEPKFHDYRYESLCCPRKIKFEGKGKKVKFTLEKTMKAQKGNGGIALPFL